MRAAQHAGGTCWSYCIVLHAWHSTALYYKLCLCRLVLDACMHACWQGVVPQDVDITWVCTAAVESCWILCTVQAAGTVLHFCTSMYCRCVRSWRSWLLRWQQVKGLVLNKATPLAAHAASCEGAMIMQFHLCGMRMQHMAMLLRWRVIEMDVNSRWMAVCLGGAGEHACQVKPHPDVGWCHIGCPWLTSRSQTDAWLHACLRTPCGCKSGNQPVHATLASRDTQEAVPQSFGDTS